MTYNIKPQLCINICHVTEYLGCVLCADLIHHTETRWREAVNGWWIISWVMVVGVRILSHVNSENTLQRSVHKWFKPRGHCLHSWLSSKWTSTFYPLLCPVVCAVTVCVVHRCWLLMGKGDSCPCTICTALLKTTLLGKQRTSLSCSFKQGTTKSIYLQSFQSIIIPFYRSENVTFIPAGIVFESFFRYSSQCCEAHVKCSAQIFQLSWIVWQQAELQFVWLRLSYAWRLTGLCL